jgi:hypothetical protein
MASLVFVGVFAFKKHTFVSVRRLRADLSAFVELAFLGKKHTFFCVWMD